MKHNYNFKTQLSIFFVCVIMLFGKNISAQVSAYSFLETTEVYTPVAGTNSTAIGDDGTQTAIPIGFTFTFGGTAYTTFSVSTNGMMRLGGTAIASGWVNNLSNTAVLRPLIAGLWDDNNRNTGSMQYVTLGSAPNRTLEMGWDNINVGGSGATSATNTASFKIRLYETSGVVELVYGGTLATAGTLSASIGLNDMTSFLSVTPAPASTISSVTANNAIASVTDLVGKKYVFTPPPPCSGTPTAGTITGVSSLCSGTGTTLTLTGATSAPGISYQWASSTTSGGPYTNMGTATTQATGILTSSMYYIVTTTCSASGLTATTPEQSVIVNPNPTVLVSPTAASMCQPGAAPVTLTASGASTYAWTPPGGLSATTGAVVSASPVLSRTYTVTGTDASGCTGTATAAITVSPNVIINSVTATPPSVCSGGNSILAVSASTGGAYCDPIYSTGTGAGDYITNVTLGTINNSTGASASPYHTYYNSLSTNLTAGSPYTITGTINNGGTEVAAVWIDFNQDSVFDATEKIGEQTTLSFSIPFTVPAGAYNGTTRMRVMDVYNTTGLLPCNSYTYGEVEDYNVNISGGINNLSYVWSPSTFLSGTTSPTEAATGITTTTTYTATVTSGAGCSSTGTVTVASGTALTSTSNITPSSTVCAGTTDTLHSIPSGGGGPYTFAWTGPNGFTSTLQNPPIYASALAAGTYTVTVTDNCTATSVTNVTLTVNPIPSVTVSPTTGLICLPGGSPVTLTAAGASSYNWSPSAGLTGVTGVSVNANPATSTGYIVIGTDGNGCIDTASTFITVAPIPTVTASASPTAVCVGDTSQLQTVAVVPPTYTVTNIAFAPIPTPGTGVTTLCDTAVAIVPLSAGSLDDGDWINQPLPFGFNFFGTTYTSFAVSSNGFIALGAGSPTTYSGYGNPFPATFAAHPAIGPDYADLDFRATGTINYFTTGTAPNRMFVVNFSGGQYFSETGSLTTQIIIYETTNVIEVHTTNLTGDHNGVEGIQNATGVIAYTVGGRNSEPWSVTTPDAYRFTPDFGSFIYSWSPATFLNSTSISNPLAQTITSSTTYTVIATETSGCSASASVSVSAGTLLTSVSSISSPAICASTPDTLNVVPNGGGAPYTYAWSGPAGFTSAVQSPVIIATAATAGTYTVTVTDHCSATSVTNVTLTVNPLPTVTVSPDSALYCNPGTPVALTASGATTYNWSPSAGLSAVTGANVNASPTATTAYTVIGTNVNGCKDTATASIIVSLTPILALTATPPSICTTGNSQLLAAASLPPSSYTVTNIPFAPISTPGAGVTTLCNASVITVPLSFGSLDDGDWINQPLPFTFNFFGTNYNSFALSTNGFIALGSGSPTTYTGYGNALPYTFSAHPCIGPDYADLDFRTLGTINYFTTGSAPNRMFVINLSGGQYYSGTGSLTTQIIIYESTNVIEVHTTNATGTNTGVEGIQNASGTIAYTVAGRNAVPWSVTTPDAYRFSPPMGSYTYAWSPSTFLTGTTISNPVATGINVTTPYTVIVTELSGCSVTGNITISVSPTPAAPTASGTTICSGTTASLTASGADTLIWYNMASGGVAVGGGSSFVTPLLDSTTTYYVHDSTAAGCVSITPVTVIVDTVPTARFTYSPVSNVVTFTNTSTTGGAATGVSYIWNFGDGSPTSTVVNPVHTYTANGSYNIQLIIHTPCGADTITHPIIITNIGIQENSLGGISIYPNPTSGMFSITMTNANFTELTISIVDLQGKEVYGTIDKNISANYVKEINLEGLAKGIYYIKLNTGAGIKIQKLIIQ